MSKLRLAPCNNANYEIFLGWFQQRVLDQPIPSKNAVFISDEKGLVGGVILYITDGPWMFAEHASVRPDESPAMIDKVLRFGLRSVRELGNVFCKVPLVHVTNGYLAKVMEQCGFIHSPSQVFFAMPGEVPEEPEKGNDPEPAPEEPKKKKVASICVHCGSSFLDDEHSESCHECENKTAEEETEEGEGKGAQKSSKRKRARAKRKGKG